MPIKVDKYSSSIKKEIIDYLENNGFNYELNKFMDYSYKFTLPDLIIKILGTCHNVSYIYLSFAKENLNDKYKELLDILVCKKPEKTIIELILNEPVIFTNNTVEYNYEEDDDLYS